MRRPIRYALAWTVGCALALPAYMGLRWFFSPWSAIGEGKIVMLASDYCPTSRKAVLLVQSDERLSALIVPVPADGAEIDQPDTCAAALENIGREHGRVNWLPKALACQWLEEEVDEAIQRRAVPTPSWYHRGEVITFENPAREAELFEKFGWVLEWTALGLQLVPIGESRTGVPERGVERLEDLGIDPFRPMPP